MVAEALGDVRGLIDLLIPTDVCVRLISCTAGSLGRCRRVAPCLLQRTQCNGRQLSRQTVDRRMTNMYP